MLPVLFEGTVGGVPVTVPAYPVFLALATIVASACWPAQPAGWGLAGGVSRAGRWSPLWRGLQEPGR